MEIVFLLYDGMTALDALGPHEILSRLPGVKVQRTARNSGIVHTDSAGLELIAEYSLKDVTRADVLVVPGAGSATTLRNYPEMLAWIRSIHETTTWTTSVCTGSLILGAAGLLSGLQATTHKYTVRQIRTTKTNVKAPGLNDLKLPCIANTR